MLVGEIGRSISALTSNKPYVQRSIKKVLIWCDPEDNLYFGQNEKDYIVSILNSFQIEPLIFNGSKECIKSKFIQHYSSNDYDLIWIMCHGSFDSDDPTKSLLFVEKDNPITAKELSDISPKDRMDRRLLVLNACQSSVSSVRYNSMGFTGLGTMITSEGQSVIGHLWSVDSRASAVFGTLLLKNLMCTAVWTEAMVETIITLRQENERIIDSLKEIVKDFSLITPYTTLQLRDLYFSCSSIIYI
nr:CHAT domain-containing protein [Paenibacillus alba]